MHPSEPPFNQAYKTRIDALLNRCLDIHCVAANLVDGMRYACLLGGKRLRPLLVYHTANLLSVDLSQVDACALAVELIHCYSLVHDDLPAMDDDALRRGSPTCHVKFNEATAILVGDALQSLAYEVLASDEDLDPALSVCLIRVLARASGTLGMAAGQALDLEAESGAFTSLSHLEKIHRLKTGKLVTASMEMACIACQLEDEIRYQALMQYSQAIGLAFQVQDDILDLTGTSQQLGKQTLADVNLNKLTYPALLGLDGAREKSRALVAEAVEALAPFSGPAKQPLIEIARYVIARKN